MVMVKTGGKVKDLIPLHRPNSQGNLSQLFFVLSWIMLPRALRGCYSGEWKPLGFSTWVKSASQDWLFLGSPGISEIGSDLKITWGTLNPLLFQGTKTHFRIILRELLNLSSPLMGTFRANFRKQLNVLMGERRENAKFLRDQGSIYSLIPEKPC